MAEPLTLIVELTMRTFSLLSLSMICGIALAGVAQSQGTPKTTNPVPTNCAQLAAPGAKDECARSYNQTGGQGLTNGTGVGKGQGQGQGVGQGSGQGATHGIGTGNKK